LESFYDKKGFNFSILRNFSSNSRYSNKQNITRGDFIKFYDSELKVLEILWRYGDLSASELCKKLKEKTGWSRTTSYTIIKKCVEKGMIERIEPNFICKAAVSQKEVRKHSFSEILSKLFNNSKTVFFQTFINNESLTSEEKEELKNLIKKLR